MFKIAGLKFTSQRPCWLTIRKLKSVFLRWELKSFFMQILRKKKMVLLRQLTALSRARKLIIMTNQIKLLTLNNHFC